MGYMHIENLYKNQDILLFKECYALEKIHGTSAHIAVRDGKVHFFSGGESHDRFIGLFNIESLQEKFRSSDGLTIFGEAYGGKQQGMSATYGKELRFVAFDVQIGTHWLEVPRAEELVRGVGLEFVDYVKIPTEMKFIDEQKLRPSVQSKRNGVEGDKKREGVVLRPLIELIKKNGNRIISKHKNDDFMETKTVREVSPEKMKVLEDAKAIADEWVTEMRLSHVLQNFPNPDMKDIPLIMKAMNEDVAREAKGEILESKDALRAIGKSTAEMFRNRLKNSLMVAK